MQKKTTNNVFTFSSSGNNNHVPCNANLFSFSLLDSCIFPLLYYAKMDMQNGIDLLNPLTELERRKHNPAFCLVQRKQKKGKRKESGWWRDMFEMFG